MSKNKIFFKNLDSLRFIAFFGVFVYHFNPRLDGLYSNSIIDFLANLFKHGNVGVNFFFVLSGFLITYLLLNEEISNGFYNIKFFWVRRILRIWPLYFIIVFYGFYVFKLLNYSNPNYHETANIWYYITFLPNFNTIYNGYPICTSLVVLWSVGIEEQFYLIWPLLFKLKNNRVMIFIFLILISLIFRYFVHANFLNLTFNTISFIGDLAMGGGLAFFCFNKKINIESIHLSKYISLIIYTLGILFILLNHILFNQFYHLIFMKNLIYSCFFCFVLFDQIYIKTPLFQFGKIIPMNYLGKYTYGLYCIHSIGIIIGLHVSRVIHLSENTFWVLTGEFAISLFITIILAMLSYKIIEKPFLFIKDKKFSSTS